MSEENSLQELLLKEERQALTEQNDQLNKLNNLGIEKLKETIITISSEIDEQNRLLDDLDDNVEKYFVSFSNLLFLELKMMSQIKPIMLKLC